MQDTRPDDTQLAPPEDIASRSTTRTEIDPDAPTITDLSVDQLSLPNATTETLNQPSVTEKTVEQRLYSDPTAPYRKAPGLPPVLKALIFVIALLLLLSGTAFIAYGEVRQYRTSLNHSATSVARSTTDAQKSAQLQEQKTADALNTAQSNIEASATAQAYVQAQATAALDNATATASARNDFYTMATNGIPQLDDALNDNTGAGKWDEGSLNSNTGCFFKNDGYHIKEGQQGKLQPCLAQATRFSSFAYQVHVSIAKGGQGGAGLLVRADTENKSYYFFYVSPDGSFSLDLYNNDQGRNLLHGKSASIQTELGSSNQLTIIADSNNFYLYVNGDYLGSATDTIRSVGKVGLAVVNTNTPVDAVFTDAQVWMLSNQSTSPSNSNNPDNSSNPGDSNNPNGNIFPHQSPTSVVP